MRHLWENGCNYVFRLFPLLLNFTAARPFFRTYTFAYLTTLPQLHMSRCVERYKDYELWNYEDVIVA